MFKFEHYYYKEDGDPKIILSLDWFVYEDRWSQRYMFDHPMWESDMMERMRISNLNRCEWFRMAFNLFGYKIYLDIKLKHVGNVYNGRQMEDGPKPSPLKRKREE